MAYLKSILYVCAFILLLVEPAWFLIAAVFIALIQSDAPRSGNTNEDDASIDGSIYSQEIVEMYKLTHADVASNPSLLDISISADDEEAYHWHRLTQ